MVPTPPLLENVYRGLQARPGNSSRRRIGWIFVRLYSGGQFAGSERILISGTGSAPGDLVDPEFLSNFVANCEITEKPPCWLKDLPAIT